MTASRVEPACMSARLPISSFLVVRTAQAPVAQLDRALPSEGRGREFESRRVRHFINYLDDHLRNPPLLRQPHGNYTFQSHAGSTAYGRQGGTGLDPEHRPAGAPVAP